MRDSTVVYRPNKDGVVEIGNAHGKVALFLDETEANDLAYLYDSRDEMRNELLRAVEVAYPKMEGTS